MVGAMDSPYLIHCKGHVISVELRVGCDWPQISLTMRAPKICEVYFEGVPEVLLEYLVFQKECHGIKKNFLELDCILVLSSIL